MTDSIVALDISYSGLGMCGLPLDLVQGTDVTWRRALFATAPKQAVTANSRRILAQDVRVFVARVAIHIGPVRAVFAENVPNSGFQIVNLAKLHALIELELQDLGLELQVANQSTARKFVFGRGTPPRGLSDTQKKAWVFEPLRLAGAPVSNHNEADALVAGMFGLSELGAPCLAGLLTPREGKVA